MTEHRIVCTDRDTTTAHKHIIAVGTGTDPAKATKRWTVTEARAAIAGRDRFYTVSPTSGAQADVEPFDCACGVKTLRSNPDDKTDNNLDNLRICHWTSS